MEIKKPSQEFGKRKPLVPDVARPVRPGPPAKRSGQVALLLLRTFGDGCPACTLIPRGNGGGVSSRCSVYSSEASSNHSAAGTSSTSSGGVTRGGFGSFAHAFGFSG